ncbi:MAG: HIT family protein [Oscillospiraceae bacterium]|nr:HIT family protein [Oscillospiraceae bacterium]
MDSCIFCDYKNNKKETILFENEFCVCIAKEEKILIGSCIIIPKVHRETVFDLDDEEWKATKELIGKVKSFLDSKYNPDGYNVGWNCGDVGGQSVFHAHLHIIPIYSDEPYAGYGIRNWIKREENIRPSVKLINAKNKTDILDSLTGIIPKDASLEQSKKERMLKYENIFA